MCYNADEEQYEISLQRNAETPIKNIVFLLSSDKDIGTELWECNEKCQNCRILNSDEFKKYYLISENKEEREKFFRKYNLTALLTNHLR